MPGKRKMPVPDEQLTLICVESAPPKKEKKPKRKRIDTLEKRITLLEAEVTLIMAQLEQDEDDD